MFDKQKLPSAKMLRGGYFFLDCSKFQARTRSESKI